MPVQTYHAQLQPLPGTELAHGAYSLVHCELLTPSKGHRHHRAVHDVLRSDYPSSVIAVQKRYKVRKQPLSWLCRQQGVFMPSRYRRCTATQESKASLGLKGSKELQLLQYPYWTP